MCGGGGGGGGGEYLCMCSKSSLKPLDQMKRNFMWNHNGTGLKVEEIGHFECSGKLANGEL